MIQLFVGLGFLKSPLWFLNTELILPYPADSDIHSILFSIIRNKAINVYKKRRNIDLEQYEGYVVSNPENDYLLSEMKDMVNTKLKVLHTDYQQALYLYEYENMSYKDIAVIIIKNLSNV